MSEGQKPVRRPSRAKGSFTFRLTSALRSQIEASAAEAGRTLSEEVEVRLAQSFQPVQSAPNPHDFETRVRQIVCCVLDERTGRHNLSVRIICPLRAGDDVCIPFSPRPQDSWRY